MGSLSLLIIMQLGRSFLLFISLVFSYCAADIQIQHKENVVDGLNEIETGEIGFKDQSESIVSTEAPEELSSNEIRENVEEPELDESESFVDIKEFEQIEEITLSEREANEEENIQLIEEFLEDTEDDFSEFDVETTSLDIDGAAEVILEELKTEKTIGFFGRLARSLSFGKKN